MKNGVWFKGSEGWDGVSFSTWISSSSSPVLATGNLHTTAAQQKKKIKKEKEEGQDKLLLTK